MEINVALPYPLKLSVNNYWKRSKTAMYRNPLATAYRKEVYYIIAGKLKFKPEDNIRMEIKMYPPDNRMRDLDNICKATLDALQHSGIYKDDNQITQLYIEKQQCIKGGKLEIKMISLDNETVNGAKT